MSDRTVTRATPDSEAALCPIGAQSWLPPGALISDRYRVIRHLGSGGMGAVFEVEHLALEQRCALKVLLPQLAHHRSTVKRFHREARAMAKVQSAHVTRIMDFGSLEDGLPYFVMELLRGEDLAQVLERENRLSLERALRLTLDACWGLGAVHDAKLIHRDIKPANLFLTKDDSGTERCKLLDFGVIKSGLTTDTGSSRLIGTLRYMAPEQLNSGEIDARTDVYALSAVLYECLSGRPPHQSDRLERVLFAIMNETPIPLAQSCPGIPKALDLAICRGLARSPQERFGSARELAETLEPLLTGKGQSVPMAPQDSTVGVSLSVIHQRDRRRKRLIWVAMGIIGLGAATGGLAVPALRNRSSAPHSSGAPRGGLAPNPQGVATVSLHATRTDTETVTGSPTSVNGVTERTKSGHSAASRPPVGTQREYRGGADSTTRVPPKRGQRAEDAALLRIGSETTQTSIDPQNPYGN